MGRRRRRVILMGAAGGGTQGSVAFTDATPDAGNTLTITVTDPDLNTDPDSQQQATATVVNGTTGESEAVTCTETGNDTGIFEGTLDTTLLTGAGTDDDGDMNVLPGDVLTVTYTDASPAGDRTDTATVAALVESLIDRTEGTNFGDMTAAGGIAAAFDGVTSQSGASTANKGTGTDFAFIGKTLADPAIFSRAVIHGSNSAGFLNNNAEITITIYGHTGSAPTSEAEVLAGTALGSITFTDTGDESAGREITNTAADYTAFDHLTAYIWRTDEGTNAVRAVAEVVLYEQVPAS